MTNLVETLPGKLEKNHPERKALSTIVLEFVSAEAFEALRGAKGGLITAIRSIQ